MRWVVRFLAWGLLAASGVLVAAPFSRAAVTVTRDVQYGEAGGERLLLDVYRPGGGGTHPGVIAVHGGRWAAGDKSDIPGEDFAQRGYVVFAINYRLAPEHPYPAAIEDVRTAVRWVRDHAQQYGAQPDRIWALGGSAGGHLVGLLATNTGGEARPPVAVSYSGPMDLKRLAESSETAEKAVREFLGCSKWNKQCRKRARDASPIAHVDPSDPPMYLANGTEEAIPLDQATSMVGALEDASVAHRFRKIQGRQHSFQYLRQVIVPSTTFASQHLGAPPPDSGDGSAPGEPSQGSSPGAPREGGDAGDGRGGDGDADDVEGSPRPETSGLSPGVAQPRRDEAPGEGWSWVLVLIVAAAVGGAVTIGLIFRERGNGP